MLLTFQDLLVVIYERPSSCCLVNVGYISYKGGFLLNCFILFFVSEFHSQYVAAGRLETELYFQEKMKNCNKLDTLLMFYFAHANLM